MKALVVGYGSIGSRHCRILNELGCEVAVVSSRPVADRPCFLTIAQAMAFRPDYVVVATETARHHACICELAAAGFSGKVLVEKPLFHQACRMPSHRFRDIFVAYNLRFHPLLTRTKALLEGETIVSVQAYVGQYLPTWRPQRDYRESYSAHVGGGGVLRDLSHELDYLSWLLGGWQSLTALGGQLSALEISSDDVFALLMTTERCPVVTVQLNYLDRVSRRQMLINTQRHTLALDFVAGELLVDEVREECTRERDVTFREMHRALLEDRGGPLCTLREGLDVVRMVEAAEQAATQRGWIWK